MKHEMICDGCNKVRRDVRSVGRDSNGDPDAPDLCFICRKEAERGKVFDRKSNRYHRPVHEYGFATFEMVVAIGTGAVCVLCVAGICVMIHFVTKFW